jgi:nicotinamide-nucleotide amidase
VTLRWLDHDELARRLAGDGGANASKIVENLTAQGLSLAVSESLTGGLLSDAIVQVPGASATYRGAIVAYVTTMKSALLGVPDELLAERGAVDPDVADAMARGTRRAFGADVALATTGVAGPTEQDGQPVGRVFIGLAAINSVVWGMTFDSGLLAPHQERGHSERAAIRRCTVLVALSLLLDDLGPVSN